MKTYKDINGNLLYECQVCGIYMDIEYLKDHCCVGNRDNVKLIEKHFK